MFEGGSDVFTSNRHQLHNNEAKTFNLMTFRTQDDAPFFTSSQQHHHQYVSATIPVEKDGCERVTSLMNRSNFQVRYFYQILLLFSKSCYKDFGDSGAPPEATMTVQLNLKMLFKILFMFGSLDDLLSPQNFITNGILQKDI